MSSGAYNRVRRNHSQTGSKNRRERKLQFPADLVARGLEGATPRLFTFPANDGDMHPLPKTNIFSNTDSAH